MLQNANHPTYRRIYQHMERKKSFVSSLQEGVRRAQEGNFAFIGEAVSLDLAVSRSCKLTRSEEVIAMRGYSIAAPLGEPEPQSQGEGRCDGKMSPLDVAVLSPEIPNISSELTTEMIVEAAQTQQSFYV